MKRFALATAVMFVIAVSANAAVVITLDGVATTGLAGHTTYTVKATSDSGPINGIDVTFEGAMNQVNPFSLATIFTDMNSAIAGSGDVSQDSQFLFGSGDILSTATGEGDSLLKGAITNIAALGGGQSVDFAQIVIADGGSVSYDASFDDGGGVAVSVNGMIPAGDVIPEPTALALISLALVGLGFVRRSN
jgi:hypothetical protein